LKQGLDVLATTPANQIFVLPVRLDTAQPSDIQLQKLHWLDLFPDRSAALQALRAALDTIPGLKVALPAVPHAPAATPVHRFASMTDIFPLILRGIPPSTPASGAVNAFYVTARTTAAGMDLPKELLAKYPNEITFVLEHQYKDLVCGDDAFSVTLWFSGNEARVTVPYGAIVSLTEPQADIRVP
jgi:hypothetical protein